MSTMDTGGSLRERIAARRAALAQTAGAAPESALRDRIAARRAALGGTAQQEPAPVAQAATPQQGLNAYFPRQQQAAPVRATGMPGMAPAGVDPQLLAQQDQIAREQFNYPGGDVMLGLARGFPVMERQAGGAMATVGNFLPGQLGRGLVRAGTDGGGLITGQLNELPEPATFAGGMAESVPGLVGSIGVGMMTAGAGPALALGAGALSAGAQQGGGQFADAYDRTMATQAASPEQAANIAGTQGIMSGAVSALISVIPMGQYLGKVAPNAVSKITARIIGDSLGSRLLFAAAAEGSQEATEQVGQMVAQYLAEDDPAAFENWKQQIALAAAGGAVLGPIGTGAASVMDRMGGSNGLHGNTRQVGQLANRGPVGSASGQNGGAVRAVQQPQAGRVEQGVQSVVGTQGAPAGTQPGDVADERSVPLMADLAGDWERQAQADAEKGAAYTERLWDELAPQEQVAAEKADPSVMPGATGQVAPPLPGVEEAPAEVVADEVVAPSGRQLSPDGMSNLRRKMIARREMLRASSQARQMQAEQDATIGRQVAPVDRSAADAIAEGYDLVPDGGKMVESKVADKSPVEASKKPKAMHEMTRDERMAEADRLSRDPVMHTPLINEGAISPTQINRMGNREKVKWQENGQRKMMNLARIRDLRQTDEQIAAAKAADDARKAESAETGQRSRYQFLKALEPNGFRGIKGSKKAYRAEFEALKAKFEPTPNSPAIPDSSAKAAKEPWEMTRAEFEREHPLGNRLSEISVVGPEKEAAINAAIKASGVPGRISVRKDPRLGPVTSILPVMTGGKNPTAKWTDVQNIKMQQALRDAGIRFRLDPDTGTITKVGIWKPHDIHRGNVESALKDGQAVPASVLADYPDLANRQATLDSSPKSELPPVASEMEQIEPTAQHSIRLTGGSTIVDAKGNKYRVESAKLMDRLKDRFGRGPEDHFIIGGHKMRADGTWSKSLTILNTNEQRLHFMPTKSAREAEAEAEYGPNTPSLPPVASMDRAALLAELGVRKNHVAVYGGKFVAIDYASKDADEFRVAAQRVADNTGEGYVVTPSGEVFKVSKGSRNAKPVTGDEQAEVLSKVGGSGPITGTVKKLRETVEARRRQTQTPSAPAVASTTSSTPQADAKPARTARVRQEKNKGAEAATAPDTRESESPSPKGTAPTELVKKAPSMDTAKAEAAPTAGQTLMAWADKTEADARAKLRDKAKKQKGKMSSGIDPIEQAETAYQIGRWAAALVVRGGVKVAQAVYQIVGKVGPVQLRTRRAAEAITNQIIKAAGENPTEAALTIAAGDVEAKHLDAQAATAERLAKAAEDEIAAGTDPQGRAKVAAEYRAQAAQLREQADAVRKSPKPEAKPKEAKPDTRPASVKVSRQRAVLNVAAIVAFDAGKALKAGTKVGNKRLGAMVDKALVRVPWMKGDREAIVRSARAILKDAGKDPAKIEAAHAAAAEELSKRATAIREAKRARGALVADMFKDSPDAKISGRQAMKERMREVGKTVGKMATAAGRTVIKAIRQTKQAGRAEAAAKIADLREKIKGERRRQADMRRIETRGAVDAAKDAARDQAAMQQGYKDQLVRLIRENMPRELRGKYLTAVRDVKTLARLGMEAGKLERDLLGYMARRQLKEAERLAGTARNKAGLERELRDELNKALGALSTVRKTLRGVVTGAATLATSSGTTNNAKVSQLSAVELRAAIADIEDAAKTIASVRFMQDNMDKVRKKGELVAGATIRQDMANTLAGAKDLPGGKDTKVRDAGYLLRKLRRRLNWDSLTVMLDGGKANGPFRQVFNAVRKGREEALRLHHEFQDKIGTIVTANGYESMGKMLMETSGVLGESLQKTVTANVNGEPTKMTLGQAMYLYASSNDVGFLERIRKGQKVQFVTQRTSDPVSITEADLASVAKALTAKQRTLVDELKAAYDQHYFEKLSRTNKDLKGVFLDKVEGYWGIKLNRTMSEMRGVPTDWRGNYIAALEEAGFMQEREGPSQTPILIGDFGHDILTRSRSASGTIAKAATTKMMMRTVLHPEMVAAITAKYGQQTIEQLTRRVAEWSGGTKYSTAGQVWKELMQMWSRAKTQLRFPTWLRNAAGGSSRMLAEMGVVDVASKAYRPSPAAYKELMQFSPIARERWAGGSAGNFYDTTGEDFADESLKDASVATMRNLAETAKGLMTLDADRAKMGGAGMWKSWKKTLDAITIGNYFDAHGAVVAYRVFLEKAPKDWPEAKRKKWAAGKAMRMFEKTANTATVEYANDVQLDARENSWIGMMTAFTGDTAKAMNMIYQAQARARSGEISWGKFIRTMVSLLVGSALSAAIAAAWAAALGKGADKAQDAARNRFFQEIGSLVPLGGGVATNAVQKLVMQIQSDSVLDVPMMDVLNSIKITTTELAKAMDAPTRKVRKTTVTASERYVRALMQGTRVADLAGIPSQYVFDARAAIDNWGK